MVIVGNQAVDMDGKSNADGVSYRKDNDGDFDAGRCTLNIESTTAEDSGLWSWTLVANDSAIFIGAVHVGR